MMPLVSTNVWKKPEVFAAYTASIDVMAPSRPECSGRSESHS